MYLESAKCSRHQAPTAAKQLHCSFHAITAKLSVDSEECSMYCTYCGRAEQMISTAGLLNIIYNSNVRCFGS